MADHPQARNRHNGGGNRRHNGGNPLNVVVQNGDGHRRVHRQRWHRLVAICSTLMAACALLYTKFGKKLIGEKAEVNSRDHATAAVKPPDELKLAEQEGLELLAGWILIGIFVFAGIFGQLVYDLCQKIGNPGIRKAARAFGKIVGFTLTTTLLYFATRVGVKASLYEKLPKAGNLRAEWHKIKITLDLRYEDKEEIRKLMFVDIWSIVYVLFHSVTCVCVGRLLPNQELFYKLHELMLDLACHLGGDLFGADIGWGLCVFGACVIIIIAKELTEKEEEEENGGQNGGRAL